MTNKMEIFSKFARTILNKEPYKEIATRVCEESKPNDIVAFFVEYFASFCLTSSKDALDAFIKNMNTLMKKKDMSTYVSKITQLLQSLTKGEKYTFIKDDDTTCVYVANIVETMMQHDEGIVFNELEKYLECMTFETYKSINLLFQCLQNHKKKEIVYIIYHLCNCQQDLQLQEMDTLEFKTIKVCKNDIIWYLWSIAFVFVQTYHPSARDIVDDMFTIFLMAYQKRYRNARLNILIYTFLFLSSKNIEKYVKNKQNREQKSSVSYGTTDDGELPDHLKIYTMSNYALKEEVEQEKRILCDKSLENMQHSKIKKIMM